MKYGVHFWVINKGSKPVEHKNAACFASVWGKKQDAIRYMADYPAVFPEDGSPTEEALNFYLAFMKRMLTRPGCAKWTMRKLKDNRIIFRLNTEGLKDKQCLFYLTWFRYVQEMPNFMFHLFKQKEKGDSDEVLFTKFQQIHYDCLAGKIRGCYPNTNHGLISNSSYDSDKSAGKPITIEKFEANIKENPKSVFAYFK